MYTLAKKLNLLIATAFISSLLLPLIAPSYARAISPSDWQAGRIIDDEIFFNPNAMTDQDIQNFLNSKVPTCRASAGGPTCLKNYSQNVSNIPADAYCNAINGGSNLSAASIIKIITEACSMNPAAMLVLIQKEQSLITADTPTHYQYQFATGYCVYDTPPPPSWCADTDGFFRQIYYGAKQFQRYKKNPQEYNFAIGRTSNIQYSPNASCGSSPVLIQTSATAGLYNYTPYQPNQAALNAGWGEAHCGAYGNRNFWLYFNAWFGRTTTDKPYTNLAWEDENLRGSGSPISPTSATVGLNPTAITLGSSLYVFSYNATTQQLELALADNTGWHFSVLDGAGGANGRITGNVGYRTSAVIFDNTLHIFYYDGTNKALRHGTLNGNTWSFETVDGATSTFAGKTTDDVGFYSTAVQYGNSLQLFYYDRTFGNLRHGWYTTANGWRYENLEGDYGSISHYNSDIGTEPAVLLYGDSLQLFYYDVSRGNLRHGWADSRGWHFENLEGDPGSVSRYDANSGRQPAAAILGSSLQLLYYDVTQGNLRHGWADSRGWHFENLEGDPGSVSRFDTNVGETPVMVVLNNVLYAFYRNSASGQLRSTWADTQGWHFATMDGSINAATGRTSDTGFNPTVTIYGGSLQLYYFDNTGRSLYHMWGVDR